MMKTVILAGGFGTRLSEETTVRPKPMVEIGGKPILWHIMKSYAAHGFNEFVVALGYKGEVIKDYFVNYHYRSRSLTVDLKNGAVTTHNGEAEDWTVHLLDTGLDVATGGRLKRVVDFIGRETFMVTYGDGLCDVNFAGLVEFHRNHGKLATVTAVRPPARFGEIEFQGDAVARFTEKPQVGEGWINGGFFVLEPQAVDYVGDASTIWEGHPMAQLSRDRELMSYKHSGFWQCMDTLRDVHVLEALWQSGRAPWRV